MSKQKSLENINSYLKLYSQNQLNFIKKLIETYAAGNASKGKIMELVYTEEQRRKMDTALPHDYVMRVKELLPCFDPFVYVYDYNEPNNWGAMRPIFEDLDNKLRELDSKHFEDEE